MNAPRERYLCVCEQGDNRSVHLAYLLKKEGKEAIAIGIRDTQEESFKILQEWADRVIILDKELINNIPKCYKNEVIDIGKDIYPRPLNIDLLNILKEKMKI